MRSLKSKRTSRHKTNDVLTEEELKRLQAVYDKKEYSKGKQEVLREFLFSCYTSLSFAEFSVLTYSDIKPITIDSGETYLILCNERTKTSVTYKIPIVSPVVVALLGNGKPCQKIFLPISN